MRILILLCCVLALVSCSKKQEEAPSPKVEPQFRNLLLITIDTLRADALQPYGGKAPTPFLQKFAEQSVVFENAYTSAPITLPAHTSLMSGLYPPSHGVRNNGTFRAPDQLMLLAEYAKQSGMKTGAVIGAFPLASQFGLNQGFDIYEDAFPRMESANGVFLYMEKNAEQVRVRAEQVLNSIAGTGSSPYFLWLHFFDPHHPYLEHGMNSVSPYHQEIAFVDQQLGLLFDSLKLRGLREKTLTILTSDHGEAFGEHGEVSHTLFVYNTTLRIPLIINGPGIAPTRKKELVRIVDVLPTILESFGWKASNEIDGKSLLPILQGKPDPARENYAETYAPSLDFGWSPLASIQDLQFKYIRAPRPEFYNMQTDAMETKNLLPSEQSKEYAKRLDAILKRNPTADSKHAPTSEEREKLAALGYMSGGSRIDWNAADPKDRLDTAREIAELTASFLPVTEKARRYAALAAKEPSNPLLLLRYAEVLLQLKKYSQAQSVFQQVLDLKYLSADAYNGLATALFQQGQADAAEKVLKDAVQAGAGNGETHYNLAELQLQHGNRDAAFREFDRSIEMDNASAYFRKARLLDVIEGAEKALELLRAAESKFPYDMRPHFEAGMIRYRRRQFELASQDFRKALEKAPEDVSIKYNIGMSCIQAGNPTEGRLLLEQFLREAPASMKDEKAQARAALSNK